MSENHAGNHPVRVAFVGSECYPFIKTGGLGDVMYALPRALLRENCEVRVLMPYYAFPKNSKTICLSAAPS